MRHSGTTHRDVSIAERFSSRDGRPENATSLMLFWHVGSSVLLFRYLFRDPGVDLRFLAAGAILPDVIDKPIGRIFWADTLGTGRIYGHTLVFFVVVLFVVMVLSSRGTTWRRRWVALAVGVMFHLLLDGMWLIPDTLLWPLFGWEFPASFDDYWAGFFGRFLSDPLLMVQELFGLGYLTFLWRKAGLSDPVRRARLFEEGTVAA